MCSTTTQLLILGLILGFPFQRTAAHGGNGMDMSMDGGMVLSHGHMLPYLHFIPGDTLWFVGWVPRSASTMVGTCIGLFLLGVVERWIAVSRAIIEVHWNKRAQIALSNKQNATQTKHRLLPFIPAHDISRGVIQVVQSSIDFALMLAVMTFQASFVLAVVVGLGVGEMLFGRFADAAAHLV